MAGEANADAKALRDAMKTVAVALKDSGVRFALAGGYAAYARGGPEAAHDVDFYLREEDVDAALETLADRGLRVERPSEDWLVKVWDGDAMVDLIYAPTDLPVTSELLARADDLVVDSVSMPVLSATDVMLSKLLALQEHYCDFAALLPIARAIREQVDWARLERETEDNAFAQAFLSLTRRLGIRPGLPAGPPGTDATTPTT